eukprot:UN07998
MVYTVQSTNTIVFSFSNFCNLGNSNNSNYNKMLK